MLSKSRCPHTGVVNFFTQADPLLSVGSVAEAGASARYVWRCYVGEEACGLEPDMSVGGSAPAERGCRWRSAAQPQAAAQGRGGHAALARFQLLAETERCRRVACPNRTSTQ